MNENDRNFELYLACMHGDVTKVRQIIKLGVQLNKRDANGRTLLHDASVRNHLDIIRILVQNGANEYVKDNRGRTPLMYASAKGHLDIVKYLIERNTFRIPVISDNGIVMIETHEYLNTTDDDGRSCLMYACGEGHNACVQYILSAGADASIIDSGGRNALMYACREGYTDLVQLLIDRGVSVNCVSNVGWSALHYSCLRGHYRLVKLLLENNINVNIENNMSNTAAYFAFKSGNVDIVKLLLDFNLQMSAKDIADVLWLVKFWTAFVPGTQFAKYEQFISCLSELYKYKTLIDDNEDLSLCFMETVYRTYMRQKFDMIRDKNVRHVIKYLLTLGVYVGHITQSTLFKSNWFSSYFCLKNHNCVSDDELKSYYLTYAHVSGHDSSTSHQHHQQQQQQQQQNDNNNNQISTTDDNGFLIYKEFRNLLINLTTKPLSLMVLCRQNIRKQMPLYNRKSINQLDLPLKLYQYLSFDYL